MDLVNLPLIKAVAATGKPVILSTGMSTLGQIEEAVNTVAKEGNPNLVLLHCNSTYPAAPEDMNLDAMETLRQAFRVPVGLSDHTFGLFVSHTAIAVGANAIERHFTLDRTMEGPDHILSSEPREMAELVRISKQVPLIKGDGIKRIRASEYDTLNLQRKSIYSKKTLNPGDVIDQNDICIKGPGGGLLPKYLDIVLGRTVQKQILEDYPVTWDAI
jgi:sialic acid synthase SpsE